MIIQIFIDFEMDKCLYFFVRLALEKSSLENVIGWSNNKLVWKKRNNGTLWLSKK